MIIINDTNIWIDLKSVNLIKEVFELPYKICVPDVLYYDELEEVDGELLESSGINILEMTEEELIDTAIRSEKTNRVSFNDLSTLVVAKSRGYLLVTGDGNLRKLAKKESVELKGTIWLIDMLVEEQVITEGEGATACQVLLDIGRRLPKDELRQRIDKWPLSEVAIDEDSIT